MVPINNSSIIAVYNVKLSLSIARCYADQVSSRAASHRVQHTPTAAYTQYSIHQVEYPTQIVCLPFILTIVR